MLTEEQFRKNIILENMEKIKMTNEKLMSENVCFDLKEHSDLASIY